MTTDRIEAAVRAARARDVRVTDDQLIITLTDGREIRSPLTWYPRLLSATPEQRANYDLGGGIGIHWPDVDEDLSVAGVLVGNKAPGGAG